MAAPTTIRREHLGCSFWFVPVGESVSAVTVSSTTWPTLTLTSGTAFDAIADYQFDDVETAMLQRGIDTEEFMIPSDDGGYLKDAEETVTDRIWEMTTAKYNNYLARLEHGTATTPVAGTALRPGTKADNFLLGIGCFAFRLKSGTVGHRLKTWGRLRLKDPGKAEPKSRRLIITFEEIDNSLNSFVLLT